ncbi:MAG TPA: AAA family ATPase, partial [Ferruginibacter sp.]|nr:AAA family ATPase [Ferruginibacter sp.]
MKLYIRNYAIIREVEVDFGNHLNIITGETGAGKSILMGALSLILGERADASVLMHHKGKCVIEGVFRVQDEKISTWMQQHEMDEGEEMIIRRELLTGGKSRSFVNDTPVNLTMLKELGGMLVDQHQQFDGQGIATESFQRSVLDALAGNAALLQQLQEEFHLLTETRTRYDALLAAQATAEKERDYHSYLLQELESVDLKEQELEQLDAELNTLSNAGHIQQVL